MHENFSREQDVKGSSDRTFGFVFAVFFAVVAAWPLLSAGLLSGQWRGWAASLAAAFAVVAVVRPSLLAGLNRWWMKLGLLLGRIVSPIALGVLFYGVFTPLGLLLRALGKDPLHLRKDAAAATYWRTREPPGPPPQSMDRQF